MCVSVLGSLAACDGEAFPPPEDPGVIFTSAFTEAGHRPTSITVDEEHLFWTSEYGDLHRIDKDGDNHIVVVDDQPRSTRHLFTNDGRLVWVFHDGVARVDEAGALRNLTEGTVIDATAREDAVFWSVYAESTYTVRSMSWDGGDVVTWHEGSAERIALDDDALYIGEPTDSGWVMSRIAEPGGSPVELATETSNLQGPLFVADGHLVWANYEGSVKRVPLSGGATLTMATDLTGAVHADDDGVFGFTQTSEYMLARLSFDGGRTDVEREERQGLALTTSDTGLYWIDWESECLAMEDTGKFQNCVEYANELRVWAVAK